MNLKFKSIIILFVVTVVLAGCSSKTPVDSSATGTSKEESSTQVTVEILNFDRTLTSVTVEEAELNGVNGCFIYDGSCYVKSTDPDHNGAYVPEGVDFYPDSEEVEEVATTRYTSDRHNLSFEHPVDWTVTEDSELFDVQAPGRFMTYFGIVTSDSFQLEEKKGDAIEVSIGGKPAYLFEGVPGESGQMLYFRFSHNDLVYSITTYKNLYDTMPEIKKMIESVELN